MNSDETPERGASDQPANEERPPRRLRSSDLFKDGSRRVVIRHDDRDYVLIITKSGKLLLNLLG